ncbi:TIGR01777 family protein [Parafrankia colletiae]|uniref:TIGR01777 family protein n=1 Tax=Parafrankia colletiae TaxID=573497 RepID=A0A1S1QNB8_9ACTN|nr:TIGR01777 family oxidoreductase [Parafrankia colletiae]MCK9904642.1 TIGR01777 family oxidoreductase [Frankia sp. Cpl3]OHV35076.1 TIGR01777 family protein [Parafrankia colletiae]
MKVAVTGSSGLIGSALLPALQADGHEVVRIVRRPPGDPSEIRWDPAAGVLDPTALRGVDAVVNLAGAGIGDHRWTSDYRQRLRSSRIDGTRLLAETLAGLSPAPRVLLSGSAIGWYGTAAGSAAVALDESAAPGDGFLAGLARDWEAATTAADQAGLRVVHLRTGIVLSARGGMLPRLLPIFRLGAGGRLGSGRQWLSWISLIDTVGALRFLLGAEEVQGPVNLVAPHPVTNAEFTTALAHALRRPAVARVPRAALRLALGAFADEGVFASQRLTPAALLGAGFAFTHPDLASALSEALRSGT